MSSYHPKRPVYRDLARAEYNFPVEERVRGVQSPRSLTCSNGTALGRRGSLTRWIRLLAVRLERGRSNTIPDRLREQWKRDWRTVIRTGRRITRRQQRRSWRRRRATDFRDCRTILEDLGVSREEEFTATLQREEGSSARQKLELAWPDLEVGQLGRFGLLADSLQVVAFLGAVRALNKQQPVPAREPGMNIVIMHQFSISAFLGTALEPLRHIQRQDRRRSGAVDRLVRNLGLPIRSHQLVNGYIASNTLPARRSAASTINTPSALSTNSNHHMHSLSNGDPQRLRAGYMFVKGFVLIHRSIEVSTPPRRHSIHLLVR